MSQRSTRERAHDILAAEAFAMPARDPSLERAHDILAAEAFAMPTRDPSLHPARVVLPDDPTGILEPHDVLAAEEFAMPAPRGGAVASLARAEGRWPLGLRAAAGAALLLLTLRLLRRR